MAELKQTKVAAATANTRAYREEVRMDEDLLNQAESETKRDKRLVRQAESEMRVSCASVLLHQVLFAW